MKKDGNFFHKDPIKCKKKLNKTSSLLVVAQMSNLNFFTSLMSLVLSSFQIQQLKKIQQKNSHIKENPNKKLSVNS